MGVHDTIRCHLCGSGDIAYSDRNEIKFWGVLMAMFGWPVPIALAFVSRSDAVLTGSVVVYFLFLASAYCAKPYWACRRCGAGTVIWSKDTAIKYLDEAR